MALRIMRLSEVKAVTGLSKTTIYRFEKEGRFPSRVSLGERSVGWFEDDVETFLLSLKKLEGNGIHKINRPMSV
jgi:prophage regulatory protein